MPYKCSAAWMIRFCSRWRDLKMRVIKKDIPTKNAPNLRKCLRTVDQLQKGGIERQKVRYLQPAGDVETSLFACIALIVDTVDNANVRFDLPGGQHVFNKYVAVTIESVALGRRQRVSEATGIQSVFPVRLKIHATIP